MFKCLCDLLFHVTNSESIDFMMIQDLSSETTRLGGQSKSGDTPIRELCSLVSGEPLAGELARRILINQKYGEKELPYINSIMTRTF